MRSLFLTTVAKKLLFSDCDNAVISRSPDAWSSRECCIERAGEKGVEEACECGFEIAEKSLGSGGTTGFGNAVANSEVSSGILD